MRSQADFFIDGGTLPPETLSYVTRPADHELLQRVLEGDFCYVLTARQMGKSSLMVRTANKLQERGVKTAIVDLSIIGTVEIEQWYFGLLRLISNALEMGSDVPKWWREHGDLGVQQRFFEFLHDVVLREVASPVAIFIDEIDTTLKFSFRDDFFAGIRAMYNARVSDPTFKRLTFILLGVATPTDLIKDAKLTPFNIGSRIELQDFSYDDATPLRQGLDAAHTGQGDRILRRIFYWTSGHPYLTQKLCLLAAQTVIRNWDDARVDRLVQTTFLDDDARSDSNLKFIQDRIQAASPSERQRILALYSAVHSDIAVANDDRSTVQNDLELLGLIRVERGRLRVRNRIYRQIFDEKWIQSLLPAPELISDEISIDKERTPVVKYTQRKWLLPVLISLAVVVIGIIVALPFARFGASQANTQATQTAGVAALATRTDEPSTAISPSSTFAAPTNIPTNEPATLTLTVSPASTATLTPTVTLTPTATLTVTPTPACQAKGGVNIHTRPDNNSAITGGVAAGNSFEPSARDASGFWLLVQEPSRGWITANAVYVSCNFNVQTLPVANG